MSILFFCSNCGHESGKWLGQCPGCAQWNSYVEQPTAKKTRPAATQAPRNASPIPVTEAAAESTPRIDTGIESVDRVLGGGLVSGSLVLLAGEPGVGKSTLFLQVAASMAAKSTNAVYITGEESAQQVAMRATRIGSLSDHLTLLPETSCDAVMGYLETVEPGLIVVDSVQTMVVDEIEGVAGSVSQVRQVANRFQHLAKTRNIPVVLVGHVNKEGMIAGPKLLEHMVDVVLSLDGEPGHDLRILRAAKNRFGTVSEIALFSMTGRGLEGVLNPSAWLLEDRQSGSPGSVVAVALEGTTPILVEVQALVAPSTLGTPRRVAHGLDGSRLALLLAVIERNTRLRFADRDVFVNLVGGLSIREPALDLAVAGALISSAADRPFPAEIALFGEIGLLGEVRAVSRSSDRVREAEALGFTRVAIPGRDADEELSLPYDRIDRVSDLQLLLIAEPSDSAE